MFGFALKSRKATLDEPSLFISSFLAIMPAIDNESMIIVAAGIGVVSSAVFLIKYF